jgi:hypothetical protein
MIRRGSSVWSVLVVGMLVAGVATAHAQAPAPPTVEPDRSMASANEAFAKGDMNTASEQIKKAAAYLRAQEQKVVKQTAAGLKKAADDLDRLSADVKKGAVKSADDLKTAFAKADHALAKAWHATAEQEQKAGKAASTSITHASEALEGAARWTGAKLDAGAQAAVDAANAAKRGARMGADAVGRAIRGLGEGIADVGRKIGG